MDDEILQLNICCRIGGALSFLFGLAFLTI